MVNDEPASRVLKGIDPDGLIDLTTSLVRINSVWDPVSGTSERPVVELVVNWAENQGFRVESYDVVPGRPNAVITWEPGPGNRTLMFEGHTDVVTPGDLSAWKYDPFSAQIVGRRMYSRGANDTKGNLAAMLEAMAALKRSQVQLSGTIIGGVLCDEEGQMAGVLDFIKRGHADRITGAVICEPQDGMICTSQKGAIRVRYAITGKMSHGAMPLHGLNTAPALARLIDGLRVLELQAVKEHGRDPFLGLPSFTPTVVRAPSEGAAQLNVMPGEAELLVDVRTVPSQSHKAITNDLASLAVRVEALVKGDYKVYDGQVGLDRTHELKVETQFLTDRPCTLTSSSDPLVRSADWATRQITGKEPVYGGVLGATDGTFLWALKNIPIVTMGAGARHLAHQVDEWVDLEQIIETAKIYALTGLHYLSPENK